MTYPIEMNGEKVVKLYGEDKFIAIVGNIAFPIPAQSTITVCAWCAKDFTILPLSNAGMIISHGICKECFDKQKS